MKTIGEREFLIAGDMLIPIDTIMCINLNVETPNNSTRSVMIVTEDDTHLFHGDDAEELREYLETEF